MQKNYQKDLVISFAMILILLIGFFIIFEMISSKENEKLLSKQQVIQEAKAHLQSMIDTRTWNAQYDGVYVKAKKDLKPNPYLKDNILLTDKNETLIKINPAWMTRQISEISNKENSYNYRIISLKPLNPSNVANKFETQALKYFEKNTNEKYFYTFNEEDKSLDFMGALVTTQACLKCHEDQGYQLGDIRGGLRVSIPLDIYTEYIKLISEKMKNSIMGVILVAIVLMGIVFWFINMSYKRQYEIEHAKDILEEEVSLRTHDLKELLAHEKNLKDILNITTQVNEMLITTFSTAVILKNATDKLAMNKKYSLVLGGLVHDNILEIISQSIENKNLIPENIISLDDNEKLNYLFNAIRKSVKLKHPIIENISQDLSGRKKSRREGDLEPHWIIVLPLIDTSTEDIYGIMSVFCSQKSGFDIEEIKILENMAHDISLALYSHKQKESILLMEKEKTANYEETILAFVNIIEQRDTYTAGHTIRVAQYCALIAKKMQYSDEEIRKLEKAAILHDIGKVATPDSILLKPGQLSHLEYELIKQHSEIGSDMLKKISIYRDLAEVIRFHHSRYDGKGYPATSSPDEIPMLSHIMILSDAFDAMTTNRIYKPRKNIQEALLEIQNASGTQFHPTVVEAALVSLKDVNLTDASQIPSSELEKRRMSYFFHDALTGLYNEDYLEVILKTNNHPYRCLHIVDLNKVTQYNKNYGWEDGNLLLKNFTNFLQNEFPNAIIIRYHGDDFIIIHQTDLDIDIEVISQFDAIKDNSVGVSVKYYNIREYSFEKFKAILNDK